MRRQGRRQGRRLPPHRSGPRLLEWIHGPHPRHYHRMPPRWLPPARRRLLLRGGVDGTGGGRIPQRRRQHLRGMARRRLAPAQAQQAADTLTAGEGRNDSDSGGGNSSRGRRACCSSCLLPHAAPRKRSVSRGDGRRRRRGRQEAPDGRPIEADLRELPPHEWGGDGCSGQGPGNNAQDVPLCQRPLPCPCPRSPGTAAKSVASGVARRVEDRVAGASGGRTSSDGESTMKVRKTMRKGPPAGSPEGDGEEERDTMPACRLPPLAAAGAPSSPRTSLPALLAAAARPLRRRKAAASTFVGLRPSNTAAAPHASTTDTTKMRLDGTPRDAANEPRNAAARASDHSLVRVRVPLTLTANSTKARIAGESDGVAVAPPLLVPLTLGVGVSEGSTLDDPLVAPGLRL